MNPQDFKTMSMDQLLQHLVKLDFDEANLATIKRQLLGELSMRLSAIAQQQASAPAQTSPVEQAIAAASGL